VTTTQTIDQAIAAMPLLSGLSTRQRKRLSTTATTRSYPAGSVILREGDTSMAMYVLLSGSARVECTGSDGRSIALGVLNAGAYFGEMGLIDDTVRCTSVIALEPTHCILLGKWDFEKAMRDDAEIGLALLRTLNARVRRLEAQLAAHEQELAAVAQR